MNDRVVLAIDQGTTGTTVLAVDSNGRVRGGGYRFVTQHYPQPGWVEHDAWEIWQGVVEAVDEALKSGGLTGTDVVAIGISNQRETAVVWDRASGRPIAHAIVWQCRRTAQECDRLKATGLADQIREKTGLVLDPYFSATKIGWLLDHVSGARNLAMRGDLAFGTVDSWLCSRLSGGEIHVTDPSNASRTLLFDLNTFGWDEELCAIFGVPPSVLPEIKSNSGEFGRTASYGPIPAGIPIAGIAGDQQAALFGQRCFEAGTAKNTYGTGCFLLANTGGRPVQSKSNLLTTVAWRTGEKPVFALEGSVFVGGAAIQWLRDGLGIIASAQESETLARSVPDTGGVFFVPAFVGLGAPYWDPYARGTVVGLTRGTTRAHLARAALEAIAFQSADLVGGIEADTGRQLDSLRADGGAAANDLLMQFQADVLGFPIHRAHQVESTARGAAWLAGLGVGFWSDLSNLPAESQEQIFRPGIDSATRAARLSGWKRAVSRSRHWALPEAE